MLTGAEWPPMVAWLLVGTQVALSIALALAAALLLRSFDELSRVDDESVPLEAMVNRSLAERYFPGRSVIGAELREGNFGTVRRVAGVVGDARENGMQNPAAPTVYSCFTALLVLQRRESVDLAHAPWGSCSLSRWQARCRA